MRFALRLYVVAFVIIIDIVLEIDSIELRLNVKIMTLAFVCNSCVTQQPIIIILVTLYCR